MAKRMYQVFAAVVLAALTAVFAAPESAEVKEGFEQYKIIAKKNIFSRQRISLKQIENEQSKKNDEKKFVLEAFILRGTAVNMEQKTAFVENVFNAQIYHLTPGKEFEGSVIDDITDNGIVISKDGQTRSVTIGRQFNGDKKIADNAAAVSADKPSAKSSEEEQDALVKRMMERRKKQLSN